MNIDNELAENLCIMADRLKCVVKCISEHILNHEEKIVMKDLIQELAYNINTESTNMFDQ